MTHQLWDIWEEQGQVQGKFRAQLINYAAWFKTREAAERYIEKTKEWRHKRGMKN